MHQIKDKKISFVHVDFLNYSWSFIAEDKLLVKIIKLLQDSGVIKVSIKLPGRLNEAAGVNWRRQQYVIIFVLIEMSQFNRHQCSLSVSLSFSMNFFSHFSLLLSESVRKRHKIIHLNQHCSQISCDCAYVSLYTSSLSPQLNRSCLNVTAAKQRQLRCINM